VAARADRHVGAGHRALQRPAQYPLGRAHRAPQARRQPRRRCRESPGLARAGGRRLISPRLPLEDATPTALLRLVEETLEFRWHAGDVTPVAPPHDTGWRTLPFLVTAMADCDGLLAVAGRGVMRGRGNAIWVPAGTRHRCAIESGSSVSRWSCVTFTIAGGIDLCALLETPLLITGAPARRIAEINEELAVLSREPASLRQAVRRKELGFSLLTTGVELSRWRREGQSLASEAHRLSAVLTHIEEHFARPLSVAELARRAQLSPPRFHAVFRRATGISPHAYVQRLRLRKAQELLIGGALPVGEVAARVGYADQFFFSRQFHRLCGMSPSAFRASVPSALV
jgi:AraC-like DNA-binding protein